MSESTAIQWTDATWNPWHGCLKVSAGCKNCYMYAEKRAYGQDPTLVVRSKTKFRDPLRWKEPRLVFTCSWSDWFIKEADAWRPEAWEIVRATPHHTYQILTKRPERAAGHLPAGWPLPNVWLGVSIENREALWRLNELRGIPAAVLFISFEPLLEDLGDVDLSAFQWAIFGGESGHRARTCSLDWIRSGVRQCRAQGVAPFVKQVGSLVYDPATGRDLKPERKGGDPAGWPEDLRIREWPRPAVVA